MEECSNLLYLVLSSAWQSKVMEEMAVRAASGDKRRIPGLLSYMATD